MPLTEFERKRLGKIESATQIEVIDLLRYVIDDIEKGEINPDGILVISVLRAEDNSAKWRLCHYRAGLQRDQEVALLSAALHKKISDWVD